MAGGQVVLNGQVVPELVKLGIHEDGDVPAPPPVPRPVQVEPHVVLQVRAVDGARLLLRCLAPPPPTRPEVIYLEGFL